MSVLRHLATATFWVEAKRNETPVRVTSDNLRVERVLPDSATTTLWYALPKVKRGAAFFDVAGIELHLKPPIPKRTGPKTKAAQKKIERELQGLAPGLTNAEKAAILKVSESTLYRFLRHKKS